MIELVNHTPFVVHHAIGGQARAQFSILSPQPWAKVVQVVVKATFDATAGRTQVSPHQIPLFERSGDVEGRYMEGDLALEKDGVDLVVIGDAHAPRGNPVREMPIHLRLGASNSSWVVSGDRAWVRQGGGFRATDPVPFTTMGLDYDRAFGGSHVGGGGELQYMRNPIGRGWTPNMSGVSFEGRLLANLESVHQRATAPEQELDPAGFAWYRMGWALRMIRGVRLHEDGRPPEVLARLWNGAHPDLVLPTYPSGQALSIEGMTLGGRFEAQVPPLAIALEHALHGRAESLPATPDTLCVLPSLARLYVVARWLIPLGTSSARAHHVLRIVPTSNARQE